MDMPEPRFIQEGYVYIGEDEQWHIKDDAPDWAKQEFKVFYHILHKYPLKAHSNNVRHNSKDCI